MNRNTKSRTIGELSFGALNYVAGLLEGEGSFYRGSRKKHEMRITAQMCDKEPLLKLQAFCGGAIYGPQQRKNKTPIFQWGIWRTQDCRALGAQLYPFMSPRRKNQIEKLLI